MAQLNLYVPDELAERLEAAALRAGVPLSRYVVSQLATGPADEWPAGYFEATCGFLTDHFPEIGTLPAELLVELETI